MADHDHDRRRQAEPPSRERAIELLEAIVARDPGDGLRPHEQRWFIDGCRALVDGVAPTMDHALGIKLPGDGRGSTSPAKLARMRTRNRLIRIAAELLAPGEDPRTQAGILEYLLTEPGGDREPSAGEQFLHTADAFMEVPRSDTQLAEILESIASEGAPGEKSFSP